MTLSRIQRGKLRFRMEGRRQVYAIWEDRLSEFTNVGIHGHWVPTRYSENTISDLGHNPKELLRLHLKGGIAAHTLPHPGWKAWF
jgi:hypothetical protein